MRRRFNPKALLQESGGQINAGVLFEFEHEQRADIAAVERRGVDVKLFAVIVSGKTVILGVGV